MKRFTSKIDCGKDKGLRIYTEMVRHPCCRFAAVNSPPPDCVADYDDGCAECVRKLYPDQKSTEICQKVEVNLE